MRKSGCKTYNETVDLPETGCVGYPPITVMSIRHADIIKHFGCFRAATYRFDGPPSVFRAMGSRGKVDPFYMSVETDVREKIICFGIVLKVLQHSSYPFSGI